MKQLLPKLLSVFVTKPIIVKLLGEELAEIIHLS